MQCILNGLAPVTKSYLMSLQSLGDAELNVASPCIGVCTLNHEQNLCVGCGRTPTEIAAWPTMAPEEKQELVARLARWVRPQNKNN